VLPGNPLVLGSNVTPLTAYTLTVVDSENNVTEVSEHVVYVGSDHALHELYNVRQPNQSGWIDRVLPTKIPPVVFGEQITPLAGFSHFSAIKETISGGAGGDLFHYEIQEISAHVIL
jgi:hypothetical protein